MQFFASGTNTHTSVISEKASKNIKKKWGQKGIEAFKKAKNKGMVGPQGQSGIKPLKGNPLKGKYTHEIKVKNKEYGDYRIYGYQDDDGTMIFDYFNDENIILVLEQIKHKDIVITINEKISKSTQKLI